MNKSDSSVSDGAAGGMEVDPATAKKGQDKFCWVCHLNNTSVVWNCQTCPRSYHILCCVKEMPPGFPKPVICGPENCEDLRQCILLECPECLLANPAYDKRLQRFKNMKQEDITKIMEYTCLFLRKYYNSYVDIRKVEHPDFPKTVAKVVDIMELERMAAEGEVLTLEGFLGELKWIEHNSAIVDGRTSPQVKRAKGLFKTALVELQKAALCPDCYLSSKQKKSKTDKEWFIKPCNPPHILAWSKLNNYPYWPAKVKAIGDGIVSVMFFGDQTTADIPLNNCKFYSHKAPTLKSKRKWDDSASMKTAMKQIGEHIAELEKIHGPVVLPDVWNVPMVKVWNDEGIRVMLPNYKK